MKRIDTITYGRLSFSRGSFYRVNAASGVGKSSLCNFIYGIRRDWRDAVLFDGRDARTLSVDEWCDLRRHHIAYLRQDLRLFGELTVMENILLKNRLTGCFDRDAVVAMLGRLDVAAKADWRADRLSIGQQQRVALVRALCQPFDFLLLDEPVSHLDDVNNAAAAGLVAEVARERRAAVITTSVGNPLLLEAEGVEVVNVNL